MLDSVQGGDGSRRKKLHSFWRQNRVSSRWVWLQEVKAFKNNLPGGCRVKSAVYLWEKKSCLFQKAAEERKAREEE